MLKDLANQLSTKANETIQDVKNDPKGYAERLKMTLKLLRRRKTKFTNLDDKKKTT